jgi:hypothetical protein
MSGFGPRFLFEAAFLGLLALAAGLAELEAVWIVAIVAVGWVLVVLVEWLAWRSETAAERGGASAAPAIGADEELPPEEATSWDIQDILAPVSEEGGDATSVVPPSERPDDDKDAA